MADRNEQRGEQMNKKMMVLAVALMALSSSMVWSHAPLMMVDDNMDGTIFIEVGFSDGSSGAGHEVLLIDQESGEVIERMQVPSESWLDAPMPAVPYVVLFDAGPGHVLERPGPFYEQPGTEEKTGEDSSGAVESAERPKQDGPVARERPAVMPAEPLAPQAQVPPRPVPQTEPGVEMAMKMMLTTQIITAALLAVILAACAFWIGYTVGRSKPGR